MTGFDLFGYHSEQSWHLSTHVTGKLHGSRPGLWCLPGGARSRI